MKETFLVILSLQSFDGTFEEKRFESAPDSPYVTCEDIKEHVAYPIRDGLKMNYQKVEVSVECS